MKTTKYIMALSTLILGAHLSAQTLSLDSCKIYALENNKRIKEAKLKVSEADQVKKSTFTKFFPNVSANALTMKVNDYLLDMETPEMNLPVYDGNPANLATATQFAYVPSIGIQSLDYMNVGMVAAIEPVYAGGRIRADYKLASLSEKIHEDALNLSTQEVIVQTENYYWSLVSLTAKRQTLNSYKSLLTSLLKDVKVSYNAGLIQKSDLLKVQLKINEVNTNQLKLENSISLLKMALCQHIGIEYSDNMTLQDTVFQVIAPDELYTSPDAALANRSEYQVLNKMIDAELLQKRLARGEFLPQLSVGVQGLYLGLPKTNMESLGRTTSSDARNKTYGIAFATLSVPISDWWGGSHKIKEHNIKIDIARNNLDEKSELLKLQMHKTYKELDEGYQQIKVAESLSEEAQEHLKVVNDNFKAGIMSTSDLLEAQAMFQESQDGLIDAKSTYQIRQILYKQAIAQSTY